jgi:hypothetical protein
MNSAPPSAILGTLSAAATCAGLGMVVAASRACSHAPPGTLGLRRARRQVAVSAHDEPPSFGIRPIRSSVPFTEPLRLAVAAYLARFTGSSREHTESDLRCYLSWYAGAGLDPLAARSCSCHPVPPGSEHPAHAYLSARACIDKAAFYEVPTRHRLPVPRTWLPGEVSEVPDGVPLVVKPRYGQGSKGVYFCSERLQAAVLCELVPGKVIQERVTGRSSPRTASPARGWAGVSHPAVAAAGQGGRCWPRWPARLWCFLAR